MPAKSVSTLSENQGPSIWMETEDHEMTASWGTSSEAEAYRQAQADLIAQGKLREAVMMDIQNIRNLFGNKYDEGIQQMLEYLDTIPDWMLELE